MVKRLREDDPKAASVPLPKKPQLAKDDKPEATAAPEKTSADKSAKSPGDVLESVASRCRDNITGMLLVDPVVAEDGHTYERKAILEWFRRRSPHTSPLTHEHIGTLLKPNYAIRAIVEDLANSPGLSDLERAEWHVARAKLHCERPRADASARPKNNSRIPDVRAARAAFERAEKLLEESSADESAAAMALGNEAKVCRQICDHVIFITHLRDTATATGLDVAWAESAFDSVFRCRGIELSRFQKLAKGTRVRVVNDRTLVLAAFEAQDDVLGLPDDWEVSLGDEFVVENYDSNDSTYIIVKPDAFDELEDNTTSGKWWPFSVVSLLP
ncbi:hypothetical protein M885DRAFT_528654 [Pelagophyceae sp. CCMP2097]|nr:hypothetical protein M885DRAFT_528654 [Pelagophyceae sp. CCMP2097]